MIHSDLHLVLMFAVPAGAPNKLTGGNAGLLRQFSFRRFHAVSYSPRASVRSLCGLASYHSTTSNSDGFTPSFSPLSHHPATAP